jgi:hypothetical protein
LRDVGSAIDLVATTDEKHPKSITRRKLFGAGRRAVAAFHRVARPDADCWAPACADCPNCKFFERDEAMNDATGGLAPQQSALPQQGAAVRLADGCYLINYTPFTNSLSLAFSGTLRIETTAECMLASGDLYRRVFDENAHAMPPLPDPKAGIPIFPIGEYRYYLRVIDIDPTDVGVDLSFDLVRYSKDKVTLLDQRETHWLVEDSLTVRMGPPRRDHRLFPHRRARVRPRSGPLTQRVRQRLYESDRHGRGERNRGSSVSGERVVVVCPR